MMKKLLIVIVITIAVILLSPIILGLIWLGGVSWSNAHPAIGENVARVDWLPVTASNISYNKSYSFTAYEFDITESGFIDYCTEKNWNPSEIGEDGYRVWTYRMGNKMEEKYPKPTLGKATKEIEAEYYRIRETLEPTITNGLSYEARQSNGGGITALYDRTKQRAYVQTNPR